MHGSDTANNIDFSYFVYNYMLSFGEKQRPCYAV